MPGEHDDAVDRSGHDGWKTKVRSLRRGPPPTAGRLPPRANAAEAGRGFEVDDSAIEVRSIVLGRGHPSGLPRPAQPALGGPLARAA